MAMLTRALHLHLIKNLILPVTRLFFLFVFLFGVSPLYAQPLSGTVKGEDGPIGFASIRVQNTSEGTLSNADGHYTLTLPPGTYTLLYQALGYQTTERLVTFTGGDKQTIDVTLKPQAIQLKEAIVGNREDPARSIMRRAIAKAPIERMKVKSYKALVYMKGGARLTKIPWLLKNTIKKEGVEENTIYFAETISEVTYRAPSFYKNRAISVRSNMDKLGSVPSPNTYINTSFYQPKVGTAVSPLAPNAFSYYTFTYEGIFEDRGVEVNKIRVKPKRKGDDVYDGYVYIIEGAWCLHSLNLTTQHEGIRVNTNHIYTPIQNVWMPATQKYLINGNIFGFRFEASYVASLRDYALTVDPNLAKPIEIIDEKKVPEEAKVLRKNERNQSAEELTKILADTTGTVSRKVTRKALRKAMRAAAKAEQKQEKDRYEGKTIVNEDSTLIDSGAYKRDSTYWAANRQVPLTEQEVTSTVKLDSVATVLKARDRKDSIKNALRSGNSTGSGKNKGLRALNTLLYGRMFYLTRYDTSRAARNKNRPHRLRFGGIINTDATYNTVEGYVLSSKLLYQFYRPGTKEKTFRDFTIGPNVRYQFARESLLPTLQSAYYYPKGNLKAEAGRGVSQLNPLSGIDPFLNSAASLLFERNYMRLFQKDFIRLESENFFADRVQINTHVELAERTSLANAVNKPQINWADRTYTTNVDDNLFVGNTAFATHRAAVAGAHIIYTPTVAYTINNGRRTYVSGSEPYFHVKSNIGIPGIAKSTSNFVNGAIGVEQSLKLGIRGKLIYYLEAGAFLHKKQAFLPDFFHFEGNRTFLIVGDGLKGYRSLPYYRYSNAARFAQQHIIYIPRKLILSQFPLLAAIGWKETFGYHGLTTPGQPQYSELTYGIDGIFRFVRIEGVASFNNQVFDRVGFRIGLSLKGFTPKLRRSSGQSDNAGESVSVKL